MSELLFPKPGLNGHKGHNGRIVFVFFNPHFDF
jgi:hypothetical protein